MKRLLSAAAAALLLLPALALSAPHEVELRGTLLCKVQGDPRRERAMDGHYLVIVPDGYPQSSEVLDDAGFFRLRLPASCIDEHVVLKVLRGHDEVHLIRVFVERGRLRKFGDRYMYQLGAYGLPGQCDDFTGSQAQALAVRDDVRTAADSLSLTSHEGGGIPKPVVGGVLGAVLSGLGFLVAPSSAEAGPGVRLNALATTYGMRPGAWPIYTQFSSSPSLGRTLTSIRMADESVFWNPSSLVNQVGNRVMAAGGEQDEYRASGVYHLPVDPGASFLVPRTVSAGFLGFLDTKENSETVVRKGGTTERIVTEIHNEERMTFVGLGFALSPDVGFSVNWNDYRQKFGSELRGTDKPSPDLFKHDVQDVDLALTWDAREDLRVAAAAYHIGGSEAIDPMRKDVPLSRGVVGASWVRGNLLVGGEMAFNAGETGGSLGANYRINDFLGVDLSGGTQYHTVQGGLDLVGGPVVARIRLRTDDRRDSAVLLGMGIAR